MIIQIDLSSDEPIYLQIRSQVVHGVATGELQAGDALPSVRSLATDLGVNMHTVNKAYAVLRDEGYVAMRRGRGVMVADRAASLTPEAHLLDRGRLADDLRRLALEHRARGGGREEFVSLAAEQAAAAYGVAQSPASNIASSSTSGAASGTTRG